MTLLEALRKVTEEIKTWVETKFLNKNNIDSVLSSTSENPVQNKVINTEISDLKTLIGNTSVSEQIAVAIDVMKPQLTTVILPASNWVGESNPWSQVVTVNGVTANSRVDLHATALQVIELQDNDIALMAENDNGVITVYALGSKPTVDYTIQAEITEVVTV